MAQRTGQNKVLGLSVGERSIVAAEASRAGGSPAGVTLAATFDFPDGMGLDNPGPLGQALGEFLRGKGFTARYAVVGVPARWVLSKPKEVPPADADLVAEALRLQVEGEFSQDLQTLTFEYAGQTSTAEPRTVLLVAIQSKHLDRLKALAEAARLQLGAVTPVGCVLSAQAAMSAGRPRPAFVVSAGPGGVELAAQDGASPRALRHLGSTATAPAVLAGELRRAAFAAGGLARAANGDGGAAADGLGRAANGSAAATNGNGHHGPALVLWDGWGLADASRQALADAVGGRLEAGDPALLGLPAALAGANREVAGAAALAVAGASGTPLPADFLHSRLAPPARSGLPRRTVIAAALGLLALLVVGAAVYDLRSKQAELAELQGEYKGQADQLKAAEAFVARVGYAQKWHQGKPRFLACLYELHRAVPEDGKTFVTNLTLRDTMKGTLAGKTTGDTQVPQSIVDKMNATKRFKDVKMQWDVRDAGRSGKEIVFSVQFTYLPEGEPVPPPTAAGRAATPATTPTPATRRTDR